MIISEEVQIKICYRNRKHYLDKGYNAVVNELITVKVSDLLKSTETIVECRCDYCDNIKPVKYFSIVGIDKYACSSKCILQKKSENSIIRIGETHHRKLNSERERLSKTTIFNNTEFIKQNNQKLFGYDNIGQCPEIKAKIAETNRLKTLNSYKEKIDNSYHILDYQNKSFNIYHNNCDSVFVISKFNLYDRIKNHNTICTICNCKKKFTSLREEEIKQFIIDKGFEVKKDRTFLEGKELDIFIPSLNIAIEYCGLYHHSDKFKYKNYHYDKYVKCLTKGIILIHIFESKNFSIVDIKEYLNHLLSNDLYSPLHFQLFLYSILDIEYSFKISSNLHFNFGFNYSDNLEPEVKVMIDNKNCNHIIYDSGSFILKSF